MLTKDPVLRRPDSSVTYNLHTDWSPHAVGAVPTQIGQDSKEHRVAYDSRVLGGAGLKHGPTQEECFAVVHWLQHFRHYLYV